MCRVVYFSVIVVLLSSPMNSIFLERSLRISPRSILAVMWYPIDR